MGNLGLLNWSIIILFFLANLGLGYYFSGKVKTDADFYVGRKDTPWWAIGISVLATYVSAMTFLGAPAWSYREGFSVIAIHLNYPLVIVLVTALFIPFFINSGVVSIYEYQEKRFGTASRTVISLIFLITQVLSTAAVLYGTALVINYITGVGVVGSIVIVTAATLIYTALGGITAVIWTDVLQASIFVAGGLVVLFVLISLLKEPIGQTLLQLKASQKLNPIDISSNPSKVTTIWAGLIGMTLYHTTVYGANQMMMQRTLGARNMGDAKKSLLMMGFMAFFIYFLFILIGVLFFRFYEGRPFANDNTIMLEFASRHGFPGFIGIIAAAVLAASMSSVAAALNSFSTVSTEGFYQKFIRPNERPEHYLKVARLSTFLWAVLIILPAIAFTQSKGSILELLTKVGSYFVGAKLSMYGLGFYSKHTTQKGLLVGVAAGFVAVALTATLTTIAWPWYALIGSAVNMGVSIPASILLDGYQKEWSPYSIPGQRAKFRAEGRPEKEGGWHLVPGRMDRWSYYLLFFFVATILFMFFFQQWF